MRSIWILPLLALGCSSESPEDASCAPIVGDAPFGVSMAGVRVYFPDGRKPNKPVVFAMGDTEERTMLDANAGAPFSLSIWTGCSNDVTGVLEGPTGGIVARRTYNAAYPGTDVPDMRTETVRWCATGPVSAAESKLAGSMRTAVEPIVVSTNHPIDVNSMDALHFMLDGAPVELKPQIVDGGIAFSGAKGAFPRGGTFGVDLAPLHDVLGRPFGGPVAFKVLNVTADITDLGFSSAPPEGSVVSNATVVPTGATLKFTVDRDAALRVTIGVGGAAAAKTVRVRHRLACEGAPRTASAWVVGADGSKSILPVSCATDAEERTATLRGSAPWSIVVVADERHSMPCNYPDFSTAPGYEIDDVAFE